MADIEKKIVIDVSSVKAAAKKAKELESAVDALRKKQIKEAKKAAAAEQKIINEKFRKREISLRKFASENLRIRKQLSSNIESIEQKSANRLEKIQKARQNTVNKITKDGAKQAKNASGIFSKLSGGASKLAGALGVAGLAGGS